MRIRELMEQRGIRGVQIADALHVSRNAVFKWTTGQTYPTADKLPALADLLGCSIDALYGRTERKGECET